MPELFNRNYTPEALSRFVGDMAQLAGVRLGELADGSARPDNVPFVSRGARNYAGRIPDLVTDLRRAVGDGGRVLCVMRAQGGAERLHEILREYDLDAPIERVCTIEVPIPYAKHLEDAALPQVDRIVAAARRSMGRG